MTSLSQLQARFQAGILSGDDAALNDINDSSNEDRSTLFGVYRNAYGLRLAEILGRDYELTHAYLGDDNFSDIAQAYIAAHPSDRRNARWFGRYLPDFLRSTTPYSANREVAELAALEKALADAFDGPDATPVSIDELAGIPPDEWADLVFTPHPTARRLRFKTNAVDIWMALRIMRYNALRSMPSLERGEITPLTSVHKLYWASLHRAIGELAVDVLGPEGLVCDDTPYELSFAQRTFLFTRSDTIYGGSNQVQRNIVGERALGLPPEPKV